MSITNTIIINMRTEFKNADEAYNYFLDRIIVWGENFGDTKALFNVGFTLANPLENYIFNKERNWKPDYAIAEWKWYLSGDPNIKKLGQIYGKIPPIWERMADSKGNVMSNYGWQMYRNNQLDYVIAKLRNEKDTRHAAISIYDCKEHKHYRKDTPCTYAIQFTIVNLSLIHI